MVSIHAPREGCDVAQSALACFPPRFNSRTPGGVRLVIVLSDLLYPSFQFTHPGRGATKKDPQKVKDKDVSIHAPREGCDSLPAKFLRLVTVSIHAPREGCDSA